MLGFYITVFSSTTPSLFILPYLIASNLVNYKHEPNHHLLSRIWCLHKAIVSSLVTAIFFILSLWSGYNIVQLTVL